MIYRFWAACVLIFIIAIHSHCNSQTKPKMKTQKLIYVMDPYCGWCYGNSANINTIYNLFKDKYNIDFVVGGMWLGQNAPKGGKGLAEFIEKDGARVSKKTGASIGKAYYSLTKDRSYTFSSLEPCAAIVLVKELNPEKAFLFAKNIQELLFIEGQKLHELSSYEPLLKALDIEINTFGKNWLSKDNLDKTRAEFKRASLLVNGFPTLVLQDSENETIIASGYFEKEAIIKELNDMLK